MSILGISGIPEIVSRIHGAVGIKHAISKEVNLALGGKLISDSPSFTDSLVILTPQGRIQKVYYPGIPIKTIVEYHAIQNSLSHNSYSGEISRSRYGYKKGPARQLDFRVLNIGDEIYSACDLKTNKEVAATNITYQDGESLSEVKLPFLVKVRICKTITKILNDRLGFTGIASYQIKPANIKVIDVHSDRIKVVVTDIGAAIPELVKQYTVQKNKNPLQ